MQLGASPVRLSRKGNRSLHPPHSLVLTSDASQSGWGATLPPHRVSGTWSLEDSLVHINSLELKAVFLALKSLEGLVAGQSLLIRSDNTTVVSYINLSGRNSLPLSLPVSYRAVGVVHSEGDLPFGRSHSGERQPGGGLPVQREVPSIGVDSQSFDFSSDLSGDCPSAGDRPVCGPPSIFSFPSIVPVAGILKLGEWTHSPSPWSGLPLYAFPPFSILPTVLEKIAREGAGRGSGGPLLASETMVPEVVIASGGTSQSSSSVEGPCLPTHVSSSASETRKPPSHTLAAFREKGKQAGLSDRAAEFTAEALRESTRASYDSKLELFFKWCNDFTCDPYSASLGQVADFLIFLFDKGLAISSIRGYRSAIASCHRGFQDGSSISGLLSFPICVSPSF